jgi:hypothetical protein
VTCFPQSSKNADQAMKKAAWQSCSMENPNPLLTSNRGFEPTTSRNSLARKRVNSFVSNFFNRRVSYFRFFYIHTGVSETVRACTYVARSQVAFFSLPGSVRPVPAFLLQVAAQHILGNLITLSPPCHQNTILLI